MSSLLQRGHLYVISAPSGTGKTTVVHRLRQLSPALTHSISYTTRAPRTGERDGHDYFFVDAATFQRMIDQHEFIEWARVYDQSYGTPKQQIEDCRARGADIMLDIDVQGAFAVKQFDPSATLIFLVPPSMEVLEQRLRKRGTESAEAIARRLRQAQYELAQQHRYDAVFVNHVVDETCAQILALIHNRRTDNAGTPR